MPNGAPSRFSTSMVWPRPPRVRPGPPLSGRSSFFQNTSGVIASVASTGTLRTPEGKGVAERPSRPGRAPAPPEWKLMIWNGVDCEPARAVIPWPAPSLSVQSAEQPSAGTRSGIAWYRQPNATSGSMWPILERA